MLRYSKASLNAFFSVGFLEEDFQVGSRQCIPHYTILLCLDSDCSLACDTSRISLGTATGLTLSPGTLLEVDRLTSRSVYCIQFNREFYCVEYHDAEVSCNGLLFNTAMQPPVIDIPQGDADSVNLVLQMLEREFENADRLQLEMLRVLLKRLIITCARLVKEKMEKEQNLLLAQTDLLRSYSALVDKHYRSKHKVADYAALLNRSPKTLSNLFVRYAGRSALQVIHERIVLEAQRLLLLTDKTAKEIAFELGFSDAAQFLRLFKKVTGHTTQELRDARIPVQ
ncbi:helix-turn-helix domain-containing protein [bacterium]|nr:helix-turn-helix domain-containing protein [bacterium]